MQNSFFKLTNLTLLIQNITPILSIIPNSMFIIIIFLPLIHFHLLGLKMVILLIIIRYPRY